VSLVWAAILGYFIGAIPFSYIIPKLKGVDITKVGSGNVGGTNVLRNMGTKYGALAMFLDIMKAVIAVLIFKQFGEHPMVMAGAMSVIGHCYSPFVKFKGGKGVATTLGTFFAIYPCTCFQKRLLGGFLSSRIVFCLQTQREYKKALGWQREKNECC